MVQNLNSNPTGSIIKTETADRCSSRTSIGYFCFGDYLSYLEIAATFMPPRVLLITLVTNGRLMISYIFSHKPLRHPSALQPLLPTVRCYRNALQPLQYPLQPR